MSQLKQIQRLSYACNAFGPLSLEALKPIIRRKNIKTALRSLHLRHCKIPANVTSGLLHLLNSTRNFIRSLSLVNVNLNASNVQELIAFIKSAKQIH